MASSLQKACKDLSLNDSLSSILECPVCFVFCHTPIFQCINGHHICSSCQPSVNTCPTCRADGRPNIRSTTLEKMADQVKISPCANKREGCEEVLNATDMAEHWETCKAKYTYLCWVHIPASDPYTECEWKGDLGALVAHVKEKHPGVYSEDDVIQYDVVISFTENVGYNRLVSAHGELFWILLWYFQDDNSVYILSCYIGKRENAANYRGKFVYSSRDGHTDNTSIVDTVDLYSNLDISSSTNVLRLIKPALEEYLVEGIFSFTAQILKR